MDAATLSDAARQLLDISAGAGRQLLEESTEKYASVFPLGTPRCWLTFLVCVVASSQLGGVFTFVGLPLITGYMVMGALMGPEVLGLIQPQDLQPLGLVTQCALAFICFSAGAELYLPELRALFKQILWQTSLTALVTFFLCTLAIIWAAPLLPFLNALAFHHCRGSVAAVAASIMVARSPASAIAIVKELRAKGPFTSAVLGMTVLGDLYVLVLFSVTTSIARTTCDNERFSIFTVLVTLGVMLLSIVIGWFVGRFLMLLMYFKGYVQRYLILPLGLSIFVFSHWLAIYTSRKFKHFAITLESLLICIVAGYVCTNNSGHRHRFILVLGKLGPYVFLPFFTLTGASLKLKVLAQSFGFASVIALVRAFCIFLGSSGGGYFAGVKPYRRKENMLIWCCLLTQAGVSLGLASEMSVLFPTFGPLFQSTLIAVILINQVVGPVLFRVAARAVGDAGKAAGSGEEWDEDAEVPIALVVGLSPGALGVAARLLSDHWAVTLVCATPAEAEQATAEIKRFGQEARACHNKPPATAMQQLGKAAQRVVALPGQLLESVATASAQRVVASSSPDETPDRPDLESTPMVEAPAADVELDEHGHPIRKMEDSFTAVVAALDLSAAAAAPPAATTDTEKLLASPLGPLEQQLAAVLEALDAKRLAAVVFAAPEDAANLVVATSVRKLVDAAPKKSPLRTLRCMALLQSASAGAEFELLATMPVHTASHSALLAAKLLTTRLAKPVAVFAAAGTAAERCKAVGAVMRSGVRAEAHAAPGAAPLVPDSPMMASLKTNMPRSFAGLMRAMKSMVESEEAGDGPADLNRREYLEQLASMHENEPLGDNVLGAVSQRSRAAGLAEVAVFSSLETDRQRRSDETEG
jgi:Kef-type K+ transport system membrane component KefB